MPIMNFAAMAADTTAAIDTGLVTSVIGVTKEALGLFGTFPLNVFLIASIIGIGIGVFRKLKH
ncbi:MAG: hypothetical protein K2P87_16630 [Lachnospiraceae bacterium]|nr:hypothetical protein [Lachnospiraceae bacterium]